MEVANRSALKEWSAIERILASGRSTLLLRKGGIWERKGGFEVEHREFWIFPTHFHQNPHELAAGYRWALEQPEPPSRDAISIQSYAVVTDALKVEDLALLHALEGLHPLDRASVESRFRYRDRPFLHALILRLYSLPESREIPNTLDYEGCISWVELDEALSTSGADPVLSDADFEAQRAEILSRLEGAGVTRL